MQSHLTSEPIFCFAINIRTLALRDQCICGLGVCRCGTGLAALLRYTALTTALNPPAPCTLRRYPAMIAHATHAQSRSPARCADAAALLQLGNQIHPLEKQHVSTFAHSTSPIADSRTAGTLVGDMVSECIGGCLVSKKWGTCAGCC
jgi:hypothetical protein